jgi:hypothetical protein
LKQGLSTDTVNSDRFNNSALAAWSANNSFAVLPAQPYTYQKADGKNEVISVQRTADGLRMVTPQGLQELPSGAIPLDPTTLRTMNGAGALDYKDAQKTDVLIPDSTTLTGYKGAPGFFLNGNYFVAPDGNVRNATLAPSGFLVGNERDAIDVTDVDSVGRVYVIPKIGANAGQRILASTRSGAVQTGGLAFELAPAKFDADGKVIQGNPLVQTLPPTGVRYENLSSQQVENYNRRITSNVAALQEAQNIIDMIGDSVGPYNSVKTFLSNNVASIVPDSMDGWLKFTKTDRGRAVMERFVRQVVAANALSDRYAVAEQNIIKELSVDPTKFWQDPEAAFVQFNELSRIMFNDLAHARGTLGDTPIHNLPSVPLGNESDPFPYRDNEIQYLNMLDKEGALNKDTYVEMTASQAQKARLPAQLWQNMPPNSPITVKYSQLR